MSMTKRVLIAMVALVLGIAAINGFLFPMEQWDIDCYCNTSSVAESFCAAVCVGDGGCGNYAMGKGKCYDGNCESILAITCKDFIETQEPIYGTLTAYGCWECMEF